MRNKYNKSIVSVALFMLIISCNTYPEIKLDKKLLSGSVIIGEQAESSDKSGKILKRYRELHIADKSYPPPPIKTNRISYTRYFADVFSITPLAVINNKGIEFAFKNLYVEAETLLSEVIKEDNNFSSACNNLGVIYEIMNDNEMAFSMYSMACLLEPDNEYYRWNFLYFCEEKKEK